MKMQEYFLGKNIFRVRIQISCTCIFLVFISFRIAGEYMIYFMPGLLVSSYIIEVKQHILAIPM